MNNPKSKLYHTDYFVYTVVLDFIMAANSATKKKQFPFIFIRYHLSSSRDWIIYKKHQNVKYIYWVEELFNFHCLNSLGAINLSLGQFGSTSNYIIYRSRLDSCSWILGIGFDPSIVRLPCRWASVWPSLQWSACQNIECPTDVAGI